MNDFFIASEATTVHLLPLINAILNAMTWVGIYCGITTLYVINIVWKTGHIVTILAIHRVSEQHNIRALLQETFSIIYESIGFII